MIANLTLYQFKLDRRRLYCLHAAPMPGAGIKQTIKRTVAKIATLQWIVQKLKHTTELGHRVKCTLTM